MKIAVTGATGYIGSNLVSILKKRGVTVVALCRKQPLVDIDWVYYDLQLGNVFLPADVSCVVHLAMNLNIVTELDQKEEIKALERLIEASELINAKFIYLSSQTASGFATTLYGKTKWEIEQIVRSYNGKIIRPGLVYGGRPQGLFFELLKIVKKFPVIPLFIPAPKVQPIHVVDLCEAIISVSNGSQSQDLFCVASPTPVDFHGFLKDIAKYRLKKKRIFFPLPIFAVMGLYKIFSSNRILIRLHSLFTLPYMATFPDLSVLGLKLRTVKSGLHLSGDNGRRDCLVEGYILCSYVMNSKLNLFMLRRYVRAIKLLRGDFRLGFKDALRYSPFLISLLENNKAYKTETWYSEFIWRLNAATSLSEATIQGGKRFLRLNQANSFIVSALVCIKAVVLELFIRLFCTLFSSRIKNFLITKNVSNET